MVGQVLQDGEIEVEGARLEDHAEQPQGLARGARDVMPENPDLAALDRVEPHDQREQCALAGAVEAEQHGEGRRRQREGHVVEGPAGTITVADALYDDRLGRLGSMHHAVLRDHCRDMAMPQGNSPTWMVLITFRLATSMTETSFDTPLVVKRYFSSGVNAMCHTRWPTRRYFCTSCVTALTTAMRLAGPSATKAVLPSLVMLMPTAWIASLRRPGISNAIFFFTSCLAGSITLTVAPISDDTQTSEPSRLNSAKRGRASTSTLATIRRVCVSMKCAMLVVSDVLTRMRPSGLSPMPSGSTPTCTSPSGTRRSRSMMVTVLSFSFAT